MVIKTSILTIGFAVSHLATYYFVCVMAIFGFDRIFTTVYFLSNFPWIVFSWIGLPVIAHPPVPPQTTPTIVKIFDALIVKPNTLGIVLCGVTWMVIYGLLALFIMRWLRRTPRNM